MKVYIERNYSLRPNTQPFIIYRRNTILYAIGDIHGKLDPLIKLRSKILQHAPETKNTVIFLGDYIDRGGEEKEVLEFLLDDPFPGFNVIFLRGNHEEMYRDATVSRFDFAMWKINGGNTTLKSIGFKRWDIKNRPEKVKLLTTFFAKLEKYPYHIVGRYLFVHAGIDPYTNIENTPHDTFYWVRDKFLNYQGAFQNGYIVVHGHTPTDLENCLHHNRICVDTAAWFKGTLTAAVIDNEGQKFMGFLQS